jgi:hypothetical protein
MQLFKQKCITSCIFPCQLFFTYLFLVNIIIILIQHKNIQANKV